MVDEKAARIRISVMIDFANGIDRLRAFAGADNTAR
jgi:hypothetical protein